MITHYVSNTVAYLLILIVDWCAPHWMKDGSGRRRQTVHISCWCTLRVLGRRKHSVETQLQKTVFWPYPKASLFTPSSPCPLFCTLLRIYHGNGSSNIRATGAGKQPLTVDLIGDLQMANSSRAGKQQRRQEQQKRWISLCTFAVVEDGSRVPWQ